MKVISKEVASSTGLVKYAIPFNFDPSEPQYLIGATIRENATDGSGVAYNFAEIKIGEANQAGFYLQRGKLSNGILSWGGCIPVHDPLILTLSLLHSNSGYTCNFAAMLVTRAEAIQMGALGGAPSINGVIGTFPHGLIQIEHMASAAAASYLNAFSPAFNNWQIIDCWGYHDDTGGNHTLNWSWYDDYGVSIDKTGYSVAASAHVELAKDTGAFSSILSVPIISSACHLRLKSADAMAAGKKLYIDIIYLRMWTEDN